MKKPGLMAASKPKIDWGEYVHRWISSDVPQSILLHGNGGELEFAAVASISKFIPNTR